MSKTWIWTAIVLLLIAGGSFGLYVYLRPPPLPEQVVYGNGVVDGTEIRVAAEEKWLGLSEQARRLNKCIVCRSTPLRRSFEQLMIQPSIPVSHNPMHRGTPRFTESAQGFRPQVIGRGFSDISRKLRL